jgi:hypothetical protein
MITTIEVTQEMIDNGVRKECCLCPVALAIKPVVREGCEFQVVKEDVYFLGHQIPNLVKLPRVAIDFISQFDDSGWPCSPISFPLNIPDYLLRSQGGK